ncbi:MAG: hypothetical protein ACYDB6_07245 [Candidatus Limnocylindrales bacterium]
MEPTGTPKIEYRDDGPVVSIELSTDWRAVYVLASQGSEIVVTEVRVVPRGEIPEGGMTARLLRQLRPGLAVQLVRQDAQWHLQETPVRLLASPEVVAAVAHDPRWVVYALPDPRAGRPWAAVQEALLAAPTVRGGRLLRLAGTAELYVAALMRGDPRPNETVAVTQRRSVGAVRDDLYAARGVGLLTRSGRRGKAGGRLTAAALAILEPGAR